MLMHANHLTRCARPLHSDWFSYFSSPFASHSPEGAGVDLCPPLQATAHFSVHLRHVVTERLFLLSVELQRGPKRTRSLPAAATFR